MSKAVFVRMYISEKKHIEFVLSLGIQSVLIFLDFYLPSLFFWFIIIW